MASYRFCRPDDAALLVEAVNRCRDDGAAAPPRALMTLERFRRDIVERDLWPSFCLVAQEGGGPVGVLLSAKGGRSARILHLAVHPAHRRRGHAVHLVDSLQRKLAMLGPPLLCALVPAGRPEMSALLAGQGFAPAEPYLDLEFAGPPTDHPLVSELSAVQALNLAFCRDAAGWCGERALGLLRRRAGDLSALGLAGVDGWLATAVYEIGPAGEVDLLHLDHLPGPAGERALGPLLGALARHGSVRFAQVPAAEHPPERLEALEFRPLASHRAWVAPGGLPGAAVDKNSGGRVPP